MLIPWFPGILLFLSRLGRAQDQDDSMMEWTTAYSLEGEHEIAKNTLLTTLPKMTKEWKVAFDINPTDYSVAGMTNLLHLTLFTAKKRRFWEQLVRYQITTK